MSDSVAIDKGEEPLEKGPEIFIGIECPHCGGSISMSTGHPMKVIVGKNFDPIVGNIKKLCTEGHEMDILAKVCPFGHPAR